MEFQSAAEPLDRLLAAVAACEPDRSRRHDAWARIAVEEALFAASEGNIGVGGVVLHGKKVAFRDHNRQFVPYFRNYRPS